MNPGEAEICDEADQDCDGDIDEGISLPTWYADDDRDGAGDDSESTQACEAPTGYVSTGGDCDDESPAAYPGAPEICNSADDDCDSDIDEDTVSTEWFADGDGDGFGDPEDTLDSCAEPEGYVLNSDDCDDGDDAINPGGTEVCDDDLDNDCDGAVDDPSAVDADVFFEDGDGDGFGTDASTTLACDLPPGFADEDGDCDDDASGTFPGAMETCDLTDEDCDGGIDEGLGDETYFVDSDGDGFGDDDNTITVCGTCPECAEVGGDCDDDNPQTFPGAIERLDDQDNNCDGEIESVVSASVALTQFKGIEVSGRLGYAIDFIGDFDGDGNHDLAMGAPRMGSRNGAAFLAYGGDSPGIVPVTQASARINGTAVEAELGFSISGGDLNGDGLADLFVGAPREDTNAERTREAGTAYIVYGREARLTTTTMDELRDSFTEGYFQEIFLGTSLDGHGDLNGDGVEDLMVGAPWNYFTQSPAQGGYVFIIQGKRSDYGGVFGIESNQLMNLSGEGKQVIGLGVRHLGDLTNDGYGDFMATGYGFIDGPFQNDDEDMGINYIIPGRDIDEWETGAGGEQNAGDISAAAHTGDNSDQLVGATSAALGDINGDGFPDFLLGREVGGSSGPLAYLYLGGSPLAAGGFAADTASSVFLSDGGLSCPCVAGSIGDLNGDGLKDMALGVTDAGGGGAVYIFFGLNLPRESFPSTIDVEAVASKVITAEASGDDLGFDFSGPGDFNGDGLDDFAVSAISAGEGATNDAGQVYLFYGWE